ncbi:flavin monoamine oxidase family protein [Acinetobacter rathckeae]|uniref:flavin monoamine oxidase family protein n=1 Tax=Acinetobacter rathckeae TaxID=2605272 RepID=UPI0018A312A3|nr:NAD(P)/FAD-dependent oxidoreductase [Acinetobacter rathckeae]MBF7686813.1 FAD-dependent oxidoreductase [Acinetobacter rathckeae]MBF7695655.1 FAD-dependent oxidoreductase [Acinetobacter rathckeae]
MYSKNRTHLPILVIGAGIAGLSCAKTLQEAGKTVIVLEAQSRLGGRIFSKYINKDDCFDLGASWIHGIHHNPIWEIVEKHSINTHVLNYDLSNYIHDNRRPFSDIEQKEFLYYVQKVQNCITQMPQGSALDAVQTCLAKLDYKGNLFTQSKLKALLLSLFEYTANDPFATELESLASNYSSHEGYFEGDEVIFPEGYHQIIDILSQSLNIKTACHIKKITLNTDCVEVTDTQNITYTGSQVIVTVPLGVLKKRPYLFQPPLPKSYLNAITQIGFGSFNKVFFELEYPLPFLSHSSTKSISTFYWFEKKLFNILDLSSVYNKPIYLMLFGGKCAEFIDNATDDDVWTFISKSLPHGEDLQPHKKLITRWGIDPFSYGSFSFPTFNHKAKYIKILNTPIQDRLFFAGEHCSMNYAGTVHGSYLSGKKTAQNVLQSLSSIKK